MSEIESVRESERECERDRNSARMQDKAALEQHNNISFTRLKCASLLVQVCFCSHLSRVSLIPMGDKMGGNGRLFGRVDNRKWDVRGDCLGELIGDGMGGLIGAVEQTAQDI